MIKEKISLEEKTDFNPIRKGINSLSEKHPRIQQAALIKTNPAYGEIVCRCEHISKLEVQEALNNHHFKEDNFHCEIPNQSRYG
jgi:glycerol-3-phosphate dehydrogenase